MKTLGGSIVNQADIEAKNGVIHSVGQILIPPMKSVMSLFLSSSQFSVFNRAILDPFLQAELRTLGFYTIFAPNDEVFAKINLNKRLMLQTDAAKLRKLLRGHIVKDMIFTNLLAEDTSYVVKTLDGNLLNLRKTNGRVLVNNFVQIVQPDVRATDGVIHVIDKLLTN